jgi:hypothetical protein
MALESMTVPATSQKRIDANRRNAAKSTGPRTPEGKNRSRFNGLRHGLAATVPVLPGEDPEAFQARVEAVIETFAPRNQVEFDLIERVAATTWSFERAARAEAAQLRHRIRHDTVEREQHDTEEAAALGQRLLWDARGPWQLYPHTEFVGVSTHSRISWTPNPADPDNPAILVLRLERTVAGCRWLLERWAELRARLEPGEVWCTPDLFKAIRLLGKQPLDAVDDAEVTEIFLAGDKLVTHRADGNSFAPLKSELQNGNGEDDNYWKELRKRQLPKLTPRDSGAARETLRALVDRHTSRLKLILARNQEIDEADLAEAPARLAFDPSPEADKLRRYVLSAARLVNQTLSTFIKVRKDLPVEDSSAVGCPSPVTTDHAETAPEPGTGGDLDHIPRTEAKPIPRTEAKAVAADSSDSGPRTTDFGKPSVDLPQVSRIEAKVVAADSSNNGKRATDNGHPMNGLDPIRRTEPNPDEDGASDYEQLATLNGRSTTEKGGKT